MGERLVRLLVLLISCTVLRRCGGQAEVASSPGEAAAVHPRCSMAGASSVA